MTSQAPDTSDMIYIHGVMREALRDASRLLGGVAADDAEGVAAIGRYYDTILQLLNGHHQSEDSLLWPRLLERAPAHRAVIEAGIRQHQALHDGLAAAGQALERWRGAPGNENRDAAVAALDALAQPLFEHLDAEERDVLPLCAEHISAEEWAELPGGTMSKLAPDALMITLGLVRDAFPAAMRQHVDENLPPPVREAWLAHGQSLYAETMTRVRPALKTA